MPLTLEQIDPQEIYSNLHKWKPVSDFEAALYADWHLVVAVYPCGIRELAVQVTREWNPMCSFAGKDAKFYMFHPLPVPSKERDQRQSLIDVQNEAMKSPDFMPRNGSTFCNRATAFIANKMGAPMTPLADAKGDAYNANTQATNLKHSKEYVEVAEDNVQEMANSGKLVLCAYYNKDGHGHLTTVRPEGVVGDEPRKGGRGPLFNDIGYFHKVQNKNFAFRSGVELHYYTPK